MLDINENVIWPRVGLKKERIHKQLQLHMILKRSIK